MGARGARMLTAIAGWGVLAAVVFGIAHFAIDARQKEIQPESALMRFVAAHPLPGAIYMVPSKLQDFRLATGAAIYVDKESIPYRDTDVLEWNRRLTFSHSVYDNLGCPATADVHRTEGVTHIVVERDNDSLVNACANLQRLYADDDYVLYAIRE
jgi:hypothetical protein